VVLPASLFYVLPKVTNHLRRIAVEDIKPGARQSALWAYGFPGGREAVEFVRARYEQDRNIHVREFAEKASQIPEKGWRAL
jgi:hypothetical protein